MWKSNMIFHLQSKIVFFSSWTDFLRNGRYSLQVIEAHSLCKGQFQMLCPLRGELGKCFTGALFIHFSTKSSLLAQHVARVIWVSRYTLHWSALGNTPTAALIPAAPNSKQKEVVMFSSPLALACRQTSVWALFPNVNSSNLFFNRALDMWKLVMFSLKCTLKSGIQIFFYCGMQLLQQNPSTKAGCAVQSHVPNHSSAKTGPHKEKLLSYLLQRALSLGSYLQEERGVWHGETFISTSNTAEWGIYPPSLFILKNYLPPSSH